MNSRKETWIQLEFIDEKDAGRINIIRKQTKGSFMIVRESMLLTMDEIFIVSIKILFY